MTNEQGADALKCLREISGALNAIALAAWMILLFKNMGGKR